LRNRNGGGRFDAGEGISGEGHDRRLLYWRMNGADHRRTEPKWQPQISRKREPRERQEGARESREGTMQTAGLSGPAKKPKGGTDLRIEDGADKEDVCEAHERKAIGRTSHWARKHWARKPWGA
jgi:hypothetical protein